MLSIWEIRYCRNLWYLQTVKISDWYYKNWGLIDLERPESVFLFLFQFWSHFSFCFGNCSWKENVFWVLMVILRPFSVCFGSFWNKSGFFCCFGNCSLKESIFWVLLLFLRPFSVCFGSFWNKSVCFGCFKIHPKHRNKPKQNFHWFRKWTKTNAKQILFRLFSVQTEIFLYLFRGHPIGCSV